MASYDDWVNPTGGWTVSSGSGPKGLTSGNDLTFEGTGNGDSKSVVKLSGGGWGEACTYALLSGVPGYVDKVSFTVDAVDYTMKRTVANVLEGSRGRGSGGSWTANEGSGIWRREPHDPAEDQRHGRGARSHAAEGAEPARV